MDKPFRTHRSPDVYKAVRPPLTIFVCSHKFAHSFILSLWMELMLLKHCTCPSFSSFIIGMDIGLHGNENEPWRREPQSLTWWIFSGCKATRGHASPQWRPSCWPITSVVWMVCEQEPRPPLQCDRKTLKNFDKMFQLAVLGLLGALAAAQPHASLSNTLTHKKKKKKETNCTAPKVTKILKYLPNEFMIISSMRRNSVWVAYNKACYGALTCSNCGGCCWLCPWSPITVPCVSVTD